MPKYIRIKGKLFYEKGNGNHDRLKIDFNKLSDVAVNSLKKAGKDHGLADF